MQSWGCWVLKNVFIQSGVNLEFEDVRAVSLYLSLPSSVPSQMSSAV